MHYSKRRLITLILGVALSTALAGCGGGGNKTSPVRGRVADASSSELFDRAYGYLLRGDPDFTRFAPNYLSLRPFTRDTAMVVVAKSTREKAVEPPSDYLESFYVTIHRPMAVRMIVADSAGQGLISYEFPHLAQGEYTIGSKGWPKPQTESVAGLSRVYVYFVGDQRFRMRFLMGLDSKNNLTYLPQPELPG